MSIYTIHYGFCHDNDAETYFDQLLCQTPILKIKTITVSDNIRIFAALMPAQSPVLSLPKGVQFIPQLKPRPKRRASSFENERYAEECSMVSLSRKRLKSMDLTPEEKRAHIRANRAYRQEKNRVLTEKNWRQHIQRKQAIEAVNTFRHQEKKSAHTFFLRPGQAPTPYSLARR